MIAKWMAKSTGFESFHAGPAYLPQRVPAANYTAPWAGAM